MKHLEEQGETYFEHMKQAQSISFLLFCMSFMCFVHSIVPPLFTVAVSSRLGDLMRLVERKK